MLAGMTQAAFNLIDLLLAVIVLLGVLNGWRKGFVWGVLDLLVLAASLLAAFVACGWLAGQLQRYTALTSPWAVPVAFVGMWIVVQLILGTVAAALAGALPAQGHAHTVNRALGLAPGLVQGGVNAVLVALVLLALPGPAGLVAAARDSAAAAPLTGPAQKLADAIAPVFQGAANLVPAPTPNSPEARQSIKLAYTVANAPAQPALEQQMLALVNQERARQGLPALHADAELTQVARAHSRDMLARGYFSHVSPEGQDVSARLREARVAYLAAGENLAHAASLTQAHEGLMKSPGHRANILRPAFGRVGIGILDAGRHGLMVTQNFRN